MKLTTVVLICLFWVTISATGQLLSDPPLHIDGVKVSTQANAKQIAFEAYAKKMRANVLANEGIKAITIITLGYDAWDFATKDERIWEARVMTIDGKLRAIIWVNPNSGKVRFVCGPWDAINEN
jgi:hypothetical protein